MRQRATVVITVCILFGVGLGMLLAVQWTRATGSDGTTVRVQSVSYLELSREELFRQADAVIVGRVSEVSATQWNQDSGEYWEGGLQIHTVTVDVSQGIVAADRLGDRVTITVLGQSPVDGHADHKLSPGTEAIVLVQMRELAWRDGKRRVYMLLGVPNQSYLVENAGLYYWPDVVDKPGTHIDQLTADIVAARATNNQ